MPMETKHVILKGTVGIFSDLHGDLAALELLFRLEPDVSQWISNGDLVDFNNDWPTVARVLAVAKAHRIECVLGNHEEVLAGGQAQNETVAQTINELYGLPESLVVTTDATVLYCCHATPGSTQRVCSINRASDDGLLAVFFGLRAKIILWGHTHEQGMRSIGSKRFVNTGHLGKTFGNPIQTYATVSASGEVQLKALPSVSPGPAVSGATSEAVKFSQRQRRRHK
jgi:predicted phosphodiesterase